MSRDEGQIEQRRRVVAWVAAQVLPHEADLRTWLRRAGLSTADVDDTVQETYARLSSLGSVDHIENGRAYFFRAARSILLEQVRRSQIVHIDCVAEIDALGIVDSEPSPERVTSGRRELARVRHLIQELPDRCRRIFELRKIEAMPQREIARLLGVSENTVEKQAAKGLRLILEGLAREEAEREPLPGPAYDAARNRRRDRSGRR